MKGYNRMLRIICSVNFAAIFILIIFSGCATKDAVRNLSEEDALRNRVMAYWGYKVNNELEKAYDYEYNPGKMTKARYIGMYSNPMISYKGFDVKAVSINKADDSANVELTIVPSVKAPGGRAFEHAMTITERWMRIKELWYHVK